MGVGEEDNAARVTLPDAGRESDIFNGNPPPHPLCVPEKNIINLYICIRKIYKYSI